MSEQTTQETTNSQTTPQDSTTSSDETNQTTTSRDTQTEEPSSNIANAIQTEEQQTKEVQAPTEEQQTNESQDQTSSQVEDEEYELELSEDSPLSQEELDAIAQYAGENALTKEDAEALIANRESLVKQGMQISEQRLQEQYKKLSSDFLSDPDFNEENRAESFASIKRAVDNFGDQNLVEALKDPVVGNNIALGKFLKKIGDLIGPEGFEGMKPGKDGVNVSGNTRTEMMKRLYPEHFQEK